MQGLKRNASRLQRLSNDILDVTRIESQTLNLVKERVNVNETILNVINDVKNQIHKPDKLKMDFSEPKELVYIEADKIRIYQVIANLLTNALKFTEEGTISISVDVKDDNDELVISVMVTGLGINSDILQGYLLNLQQDLMLEQDLDSTSLRVLLKHMGEEYGLRIIQMLEALLLHSLCH